MNRHERLNAYRIMWVFVFFDLPVVETKDRKAATKFRFQLLKDGFTMLQYSVYIRHCASKEAVDVHVKRVNKWVPKKGHVSILQITDKQYGDIINIWGSCREPVPTAPAQLSFF